MTSHTDFDALQERIGRPHLQQRLTLQVDHVTDVFGPGLTHFHIENLEWPFWFLKHFLRAAGVYGRGQRNALTPLVRHNAVAIADLPQPLSGLRLLHLSDLHCDMNTSLVGSVIERVRTESYDACLLTGDYRARTSGSFETAVSQLSRLRTALPGPMFAVLGNHDFIEMVHPMEASGIRVLLNEAAFIERSGARLFIAGVDDPHYYRADNLEKTAQEIPVGATSVLLSHTPEIYRKAELCGFDLMLCGHTHGGQICIPGGAAVFLNANCPRSMCRGIWRYKTLQGYTSTGTGVSGVDVRFNCPGEIVIHELQRA
jgi:uncharacterized protein